jgi:hypothetical protein
VANCFISFLQKGEGTNLISLGFDTACDTLFADLCVIGLQKLQTGITYNGSQTT